MDGTIAVILGVGFIFASLWARRRMQGGGPHTQRYRLLMRGFQVAALVMVALALWITIEDHR
jgi:hypothetical protein